MIQLLDEMGSVTKRRKRAILRFYKPSKDKEPEKYYHAYIILFVPWRNEDKLLAEYNSYYEMYEDNQDQINKQRNVFRKDEDMMEAAMDDLNEDPALLQTTWDELAPATEMENAVCQEEGCVEDESYAALDPDNIGIQPTKNTSQGAFNMPKIDVVNETDLLANIQSLNDKQRSTLDAITSWVQKKRLQRKYNEAKGIEPLYITVMGAAGTGKSYLIETIYQCVVREARLPGDSPDDIFCLLTAHTGAAAFNIKGGTLHSTFFLNINMFQDGISEDKLSKLRLLYEKLLVLIIDELSLVDADMLCRVSERLRLIKSNSEPFGGVTVILLGDLMQLNPVMGTAIYNTPRRQHFKMLGLWDLFKYTELTECVRQNNKAFIELLNRMRFGEMKEEDHHMLQEGSSEIEDKKVVHLFARNKSVEAHNNKMLEELPHIPTKVTAIDRAPIGYVPGDVEGGLLKELSISVGARVMVTRNLDVSDGLCNGSMGVIVACLLKDGSIIQTNAINQHQLQGVFVEFDRRDVGVKSRENSKYHYKNAVLIERLETTYQAVKKRSQYGPEAKRTQLPLKLSFGVTYHKSQGTTLDEVVLDFNANFQPGMAYVGFSRCKTLNGIHLIGYSRNKIQCNQKSKAEIKRLQNLNGLLTIAEKTPVEVLDGFRVYHINVRGLKTHLSDVACSQIPKTNPSLIILTESHIDKEEHIHLPGYSKSIHAPSKYGGVTIFTNHKVTVEKYISISKDKIQVLCIYIKHQQTSYNIVATYCSPTSSVQTIKAALEETRSFCNKNTILVTGDFNHPQVDFLKVVETVYDRKFEDFVKGRTTHREGNSLDKLYIEVKENNTSELECTIDYSTIYSDHYGLYLHTSFQEQDSKSPENLASTKTSETNQKKVREILELKERSNQHPNQLQLRKRKLTPISHLVVIQPANQQHQIRNVSPLIPHLLVIVYHCKNSLA